jgi:hypothetical protein
MGAAGSSDRIMLAEAWWHRVKAAIPTSILRVFILDSG